MNKKVFFAIFLILLGTFGISKEVFSVQKAWWGKGYKTEKWVLSHSGSVLQYTITGTKNTDQYKVMMFK